MGGYSPATDKAPAAMEGSADGGVAAAPSPSTSRSGKGHGPVLAGYAALTAIVLWPAVRHFTTRPMVGAGDSSIFYWAWWWMPEAIADGRSPFHTTDIMHPVGVDLGVTVTAPAVSALTWPIRVLLGPAAQMNAAQLLAAFTAAVAAYFLIDRLWHHRAAAAITGAAFAFGSFRFVHIGEHLNLIGTGVLPLCVLTFLRFVERPGTGRAVAFGGSLGFAALVEPQLAVLCAVAVVPFAVVHRSRLRAALGGLVVAGGTAAAVAAPVVIPLLGGLLGGEGGEPQAAHELASVSSSPFSWIVPPVTHPFLGALAEIDVLGTASEGIAYPGLVILALAVLGATLGQRRSRRGWVALALIGFVLSLGPYLVVGQEYIELPLPYLLLRSLPFMDTMRVPGRFALVGMLALCVLAAGALAELARRRPRQSNVLLLVVAAVLSMELLPGPLPQREGGAPEPYEAIARDEGEGAVLEIPLQWSTGVEVVGDTSNDLHVALFMAWATVHGKPYVGGSVSRYPDDRLEELYEIEVYRQLLAAQEEPGFDDPLTFDADDLRELGIGYVVYHRDAPEPPVRSHLESLGLPVLADDGTVLVWRVPE